MSENIEEKRVRELRSQGLSYRSIAKIVNRPMTWVYNVCKDVHVESVDAEPDVIEIIDERFNLVLECMNNLLSLVVSLSDYKFDSDGRKDLAKAVGLDKLREKLGRGLS